MICVIWFCWKARMSEAQRQHDTQRVQRNKRQIGDELSVVYARWAATLTQLSVLNQGTCTGGSLHGKVGIQIEYLNLCTTESNARSSNAHSFNDFDLRSHIQSTSTTRRRAVSTGRFGRDGCLRIIGQETGDVKQSSCLITNLTTLSSRKYPFKIFIFAVHSFSVQKYGKYHDDFYQQAAAQMSSFAHKHQS